MADSVVETGDDYFMILVVETEKVHLRRGLRLGMVTQVEVLTGGRGLDGETADVSNLDQDEGGLESHKNHRRKEDPNTEGSIPN